MGICPDTFHSNCESKYTIKISFEKNYLKKIFQTRRMQFWLSCWKKFAKNPKFLKKIFIKSSRIDLKKYKKFQKTILNFFLWTPKK